MYSGACQHFRAKPAPLTVAWPATRAHTSCTIRRHQRLRVSHCVVQPMRHGTYIRCSGGTAPGEELCMCKLQHRQKQVSSIASSFCSLLIVTDASCNTVAESAFDRVLGSANSGPCSSASFTQMHCALTTARHYQQPSTNEGLLPELSSLPVLFAGLSAKPQQPLVPR